MGGSILQAGLIFNDVNLKKLMSSSETDIQKAVTEAEIRTHIVWFEQFLIRAWFEQSNAATDQLKHEKLYETYKRLYKKLITQPQGRLILGWLLEHGFYLSKDQIQAPITIDAARAEAERLYKGIVAAGGPAPERLKTNPSYYIEWIGQLIASTVNYKTFYRKLVTEPQGKRIIALLKAQNIHVDATGIRSVSPKIVQDNAKPHISGETEYQKAIECLSGQIKRKKVTLYQRAANWVSGTRPVGNFKVSEEGVFKLRAAARKKHPAAIRLLAHLTEHGKHGVGKHFRKAAQLYLKAAMKGDATAQNRLGELRMPHRFYPIRIVLTIGRRLKYIRERKHLRIKKNAKKAAVFFQQAANQNLPEALRNLARCHERGAGVEKSSATAKALRERAREISPTRREQLAALYKQTGAELGNLWTWAAGPERLYAVGDRLLHALHWR